MYSFTIYYSKKFKLYDLTINLNNNFYCHYQLKNLKSLNKLIKSYTNK